MTTTGRSAEDKARDVEPTLDPSALAASGVRSEGTVKLTLANHLGAGHARGLGLEDKDYAPGDTVSVSREVAIGVINSGYAAGVNPADRAAVAKALGG